MSKTNTPELWINSNSSFQGRLREFRRRRQEQSKSDGENRTNGSEKFHVKRGWQGRHLDKKKEIGQQKFRVESERGYLPHCQGQARGQREEAQEEEKRRKLQTQFRRCEFVLETIQTPSFSIGWFFRTRCSQRTTSGKQRPKFACHRLRRCCRPNASSILTSTTCTVWSPMTRTGPYHLFPPNNAHTQIHNLTLSQRPHPVLVRGAKAETRRGLGEGRRRARHAVPRSDALLHPHGFLHGVRLLHDKRVLHHVQRHQQPAEVNLEN